MQKTGLTYGAVNNHFPVYLAIFGMVTNKQPNEQLGDPSASLLLTREEEVFCNKKGCINREILQSMIGEHGKHVKMDNLEDMFFFGDDPTCCCRIWNPTLGLHWKAITSSPTLFD